MQEIIGIGAWPWSCISLVFETSVGSPRDIALRANYLRCTKYENAQRFLSAVCRPPAISLFTLMKTSCVTKYFVYGCAELEAKGALLLPLGTVD